MKRLLFSFFLTGLIIVGPAALAKAQNVQAPSRTTADESFELNITQHRIIESDFKASTALEVGQESQGLRLSVGTSLSASRINVMLRNVTGRVRFRASLEPVLRRLRVRR